ncbi:MAG: T9SS type A sorting domain-containing protein [Sphingobacteriales bacterium JAD_PAG50586_3]|nr:MAG: T9SS type A sorting domain-containing protein [Sphingobacteriales bacterium JAD_PAG50586_3]
MDTDNTDKKQVLVFDMNGKVVANATTADRMYVYDARTLPAGMYMVSVSTPKGTVVKTLVKTQ